MSIRIYQGSEYKWNDWWEWWIWLDGPKEELDEIDRVVYMLHPTFPNPVRIVIDRETNFLLKTAGWGGFRIYAKVLRKTSEPLSLTHDLVLEYPSATKMMR